MKITGINITGTTKDTLYIGNDAKSRKVHDTVIRNESLLQ